MMENPLHKLMSPHSIAFMGASNTFNRMGSILFTNLLGGKFNGPIYPIHPHEDPIYGLKAYKHLKELPQVPDLLVLVIPTTLVPKILIEAGEMGINRAIIVTAGYEEVEETDGRQLQKQIDDIVKKYNIRYVGPNCIGIYNAFANLNTAPMPNRLPPGNVGLISHSGTYLGHMFAYLEGLGFNIGEGISLGNAASIDLVDALEYFEERDEIKAITMYIEGIRRPREFLKTARRISAKKPLIALYVGGTEGGARSAATHTAALSGPDHIFDAVFRQAGIVRASNIEELFDFSWALSTQPLPSGNGMAVISVSGGAGTSMADAISRSELTLPIFPEETEKAVRQFLPHTGGAANPVDITYSRDEKTFYYHIPKIALESDCVDGLFVYGFFSPDWILDISDAMEEGFIKGDRKKFLNLGKQMAKEFATLVKQYDKPVLGSTFQPNSDRMIKTLRKQGIPIFPAPERAVKAMEAMYRYKQFQLRLKKG